MRAKTSKIIKIKDEPTWKWSKTKLNIYRWKKEEIENKNEIFKEILESKGIFHPSRAAK